MELFQLVRLKGEEVALLVSAFLLHLNSYNSSRTKPCLEAWFDKKSDDLTHVKVVLNFCNYIGSRNTSDNEYMSV